MAEIPGLAYTRMMRKSVDWRPAEDIKRRILEILRQTSLDHIDLSRVFIFRSFDSKARAYARIWALPKIWQQALHTPPGYCIEVLAEKFDPLSREKQTKILIHELLHIPKTFSGSLAQHRGRGRYGVCHQKVEKVFQEFCKNRK